MSAKAALILRLADRLSDGITTGHDWPNTDDELLRLQCASIMRELALAAPDAPPQALRPDDQTNGIGSEQEARDATAKLARFGARMLHAHRGNGASWVNSTFRNEGAGLSSELIREAVAATLHQWPEPPALGMVTFVDPSKVRHKRDPGRCYLKAGFRRVGMTKGGLIAFQRLPHEMPEALPALGSQLSLIEVLA